MATAYRALLSAVLLLMALVAGSAGDRAEHVSRGLVVAIVACLAQSIPFAYFLGTGFWVKYFAESAGAGPDWERRHKLWMKARGYPTMYLSALACLATAITGGLADTGRIAGGWHVSCVVAAIGLTLAALVLVPPMMRRNAALMDDLAERHRVPRPDSAEAEELMRAREEASVPPLFQLGRILLYFGVNVLLLWAYLRFGTESLRDAPFLPFAATAAVLVALGATLHARHRPAPDR